MSHLVVGQELGRDLRDRADALLAPVGDVVEGPFEFLSALLLGLFSDRFPARFARFLDAAAGEREVVPIDLRLLQLTGLFVPVFGSVNGHIDLGYLFFLRAAVVDAGDAPVCPMAHTASSTIRQIGLPVSRESRFSSAFVSGRIAATSFGYSLVFRGLPLASASAGGRPRPRFRLLVATSVPNPRYYRLTFLAIYNSLGVAVRDRRLDGKHLRPPRRSLCYPGGVPVVPAAFSSSGAVPAQLDQT
jgi:hypothetical protein